ncbi:MAG TPA: hypothetical protein VFT09_10110, partial [Ilumatobacteraceae bacterium]|nr:hypothetical protein [Ilumatobacteraceae bacterium]
MDQLGQREQRVTSTHVARAGCLVVAAVVLGAGGLVVGLRIANPEAEPEGQNWWLVSLFVASVAFGVVGASLAAFPGRRLLGWSFVVVGIAAALTAVSTQYAGYREARGGDASWAWVADMGEWSLALGAGVLVAVVPLLLAPAAGRWHLPVVAGAGLAVATSALAAAAPWPAWVGELAGWLVALAATAGTVRLALRWWRTRRLSPDPLPGWILAGSVVAWFAIVPAVVDVGEWTGAGKDVVRALLLMATVPLLVGGAAVDAIRDHAAPFLGVSHRVLEWVVLASGVVGVYTVFVAGLGRLIGGSGPTWLLVVATGMIALLLEPARRRVRRLVDHLVYGARDDPLAVVQRIVDHLGADAGDELLPALVESLRTELRLDAVA